MKEKKLHKCKQELKPVERLSIHKFVVRAWKYGKLSYFYAVDMKEARQFMLSLKGRKNWYFEVFKATHELESVYFYE